MRVLRVAGRVAAALAVLVLVSGASAGPPLPAAAVPVPDLVAPEMPAGAVLVDATETCRRTSYWSWIEMTCKAAASDPRVTGTRTISEVGGATAAEGPGESMWGNTTLEGPQGRWRGHWFALIDSGGRAHWVAILAGDGAYAGWNYMISPDDSSSSVPWATDQMLTGMLWPGAPPLP